MDYHIKTENWKYIFNRLSKRQDIRTGNESKLRIFIEAVWFISRSGCQWRLLPEKYGSWRAVHRRFKRWSDRGIWSDLLRDSTEGADMEYIMVDSTIVRSHACSAGYRKNSQDQECLGRSKGGFSTKIHAIVDGLGNPLKFILTPGQRNDITQAEFLIKDFKNTAVIAENQSEAVIPPRKNRKMQREYDVHVYKERHLIECFFGKIKHFRRVFSRFDKTSGVFIGFLNFVATLIWLR
ncbi:MAG: IS5 family transposase [Rickettsiales bacterium]|nr:MAG: IS5 family transposase [Rickettsiales bacterium]